MPVDIQKKVTSLFFFIMMWCCPVLAETVSGPEILRTAEALPGSERDAYLINQILTNNTINRSSFSEVQWSAPAKDKLSTHTVTLYVTADYLAVGTSEPVRIPLAPQGAQRIADAYDCILPTQKIVDQIHLSAVHKLEPQPFSPDYYKIESASVWKLNNIAIEAQLEKLGAKAGELVSGIKKDVVITNRLAELLKPARVAIYGWHKRDGEPIQPLSLVHRADYLDYSHGIRLVSATMQLDGETTSIKSVLTNPDLAHLLSYEGPLTSATLRY